MKKRFIYADNAATTGLDADAFEAMRPYMMDIYGNPSQPYAFSRATRKALADARDTVAACIGAGEDEVYFTSGGTESDNWAIQGASHFGAVITSEVEHHAILNACASYSRRGCRVSFARPDRDGRISPDTVKGLMTGDTTLVSVMAANNEIGTVQPVRQIAEVCRTHGVICHTDAVQAVGHIPLDVAELGVDLLSASAHKFHGPKGVGFLYVKRGTPISPFMDGGSQESGLRAGTQNVPGIVGMACALKKACDQMAERVAHITAMERMLLDGLKERGIRFVRNGGENTLPGLISLSFAGQNGEAILHRMDLKGIAISTGSACDGQNTGISHVLRAIRLDGSHARGTVRISLGYENRGEEIHEIVVALADIVAGRQENR